MGLYRRKVGSSFRELKLQDTFANPALQDKGEGAALPIFSCIMKPSRCVFIAYPGSLANELFARHAWGASTRLDLPKCGLTSAGGA